MQLRCHLANEYEIKLDCTQKIAKTQYIQLYGGDPGRQPPRLLYFWQAPVALILSQSWHEMLRVTHSSSLTGRYHILLEIHYSKQCPGLRYWTHFIHNLQHGP